MEPRLIAKSTDIVKDVYNQMMNCLEGWFAIKMEDESIFFDSEMISVKRLLEKQDINELLYLIEFILIVAVKGEKKDEMINKILSLDESCQTDLQILMERALGMQQVQKEEVDFESNSCSMRKSGSVFQSLSKSTASLVEPSPNSKQNMQFIKAIERLERKNKILQDKIVDAEVD